MFPHANITNMKKKLLMLKGKAMTSYHAQQQPSSVLTQASPRNLTNHQGSQNYSPDNNISYQSYQSNLSDNDGFSHQQLVPAPNAKSDQLTNNQSSQTQCHPCSNQGNHKATALTSCAISKSS